MIHLSSSNPYQLLLIKLIKCHYHDFKSDSTISAFNLSDLLARRDILTIFLQVFKQSMAHDVSTTLIKIYNLRPSTAMHTDISDSCPYTANFLSPMHKTTLMQASTRERTALASLRVNFDRTIKAGIY